MTSIIILGSLGKTKYPYILLLISIYLSTHSIAPDGLSLKYIFLYPG